MTQIIRTRIVFRQASAAEFTSKNSTLLEGEPGYETDTGRLKVGDGLNTWIDLPYFGNDSYESFAAALAAHRASPTPHPTYDDGPTFTLLYENAKV